MWQTVLARDIASSWWRKFRVRLFKTSRADLKTSCVMSPRSEALLLKKQGERPERLSHGKRAWMKSLKMLQVPADSSHGSGLIECLVTGRRWVSWTSEGLPGIQRYTQALRTLIYISWMGYAIKSYIGWGEKSVSNFWTLIVIQWLEATRGISILTYFIPD